MFLFVFEPFHICHSVTYPLSSTPLHICPCVWPQDRVDAIEQQAANFVESSHFDSDTIVAKKVTLVERFRSLQEPLQAKRSKLGDALQLQQFFRDVEDEEDWIREKEPIAASTNRGRSLITQSQLVV